MIHPQAFEILSKTAEKTKADMLIFYANMINSYDYMPKKISNSVIKIYNTESIIYEELVKLKKEKFFNSFNTKFIKDIAKNSPKTKIIYYFPPGSWRKKLKYQKSLGESKTKVITPFPWSEKILNDYGIEAKFLGHPLLETAKPTKTQEVFFSDYNITKNNIVLGFLPGSRNFEIKMHIGVFAETINKLYSENNEYIFLFLLLKHC